MLKNLPIILVFIVFLPIILSGCYHSDTSNPPSVDQSSSPKTTPEEAATKYNNHPSSQDLFFNRPQVKPQQTSIKIYKSLRVLELYGDGILMGRFKIALGGNPIGDKEKEGDLKTPEGQYYICTRNDRSRFTLFLGLSYPSIKDAEKGLASGLIDSTTYDQIKKSIENSQQPPWNTPLGGAVGIHGKGNEYDWTLGCIALSDEDIRILWDFIPLRTPVEILK